MLNIKSKWIIFILSGVFLLGHSFGDASAVYASESDNGPLNESASSLQDIVNKAKPGDRIVLPEGNYSGPVLINKQLIIQGSGKVSLLNEEPVSGITIQADGVVVQGINIFQKQAGEELAAVNVRADNVTVQDLRMTTRGFGIIMRDSNGGVVTGNFISWDRNLGTAKMGQKGNGIDLYNSDNTVIERNKILSMRDGIYLENSKNLDIMGNQILGSRYGIHCMYIDGTKIVENRGEYNITGAMIMGVKDVLVSGNSFAKQSNNVNSQGILLYDVQTSLVEKNVVDGNRVGLYLELSSRNEIRNNSIYRNFVGIQFVDAENNLIHENDFVANVIEAEATDSKINQIERNFWDSSRVLDLNNDGISEITYSINPFYRELTAKDSAFQLFFQSPGISFLSGMYENDQKSWTTDSSPRMNLNTPVIAADSSMDREYISSKTFMLIVASLLFLTSVITIIYAGVNKS
ncbi:nitrous oxide reductase family maturation protein NosD [Paenibacillus sp. TH7-28]